MQSTRHCVRILCLVSAVILTRVYAAVAINFVLPSSHSKTQHAAIDNKDVSEKGLNQEHYHWILTRDGELVSSVYNVRDPDELKRYSDFDVTIRQRRTGQNRKLLDDDVIRLVRHSSTAHDQGKLSP